MVYCSNAHRFRQGVQQFVGSAVKAVPSYHLNGIQWIYFDFLVKPRNCAYLLTPQYITKVTTFCNVDKSYIIIFQS